MPLLLYITIHQNVRKYLIRSLSENTCVLWGMIYMTRVTHRKPGDYNDIAVCIDNAGAYKAIRHFVDVS